MSNSAIGRTADITRLPPELLQEILSHVPHERTKGLHQLRLSELQGATRSFKPQLAVAHVCRAWRNAMLSSKYWPGVRLSLKSAEHLEQGIAHGNGKALLYVHIDKEPRYFDVMHNRRTVRAPLRALEHLARIRTLFLETAPKEDEATAYAHALRDQDAPELQDFTFRWLPAWSDRKRNKLEFITHPFPRLRYLDLWECDLTSRQTILQTENLVSINFQNVSVSKSIDELVGTISRWTRLQYLNLRHCDLVVHDDRRTRCEPRAASLPALKDLHISASTADVAAFLTYIAFPLTAKADLYFFESSPDAARPNASRVRDAIRAHFDSPEGLSSTCTAYAFTITYPLGYGIQFQPPPERAAVLLDGVSKNYFIEPEADFSFRQNSQEISFFEENLAGFPALDTIPRLDLSGKSHCRRVPPAHILRRFADTTCLVLNDDGKSILDDITKDTKLFPKLQSLELFDLDLRGRKKDAMLESLAGARKARPSLVKLILCECRATKAAFEGVFGEGRVQIKLSNADMWMD